MSSVRIGVSIAAALALSACAADDDTGSSRHEGKSLNGKSLNGKSLNGKSLNGSTLGDTLLHVSHAGALIEGTRLDETWLEGSELVGQNGSALVRGLDFHQAELQATSDTGTPVRLRVRQILPPAPGDDLWRYEVEYRETDGSWVPICVDAAGSYPAIAVSGYWDLREGVAGGGDHIGDPTRFTFACTHTGAIGKCIELGYRPWAFADGAPLADHHQACTRLLRNDYCGDGTPHTTEGNVVNLYDDVGVQTDSESWVIEAEWDGGGASCFSAWNRGLIQLPCYFDRLTLACGSRTNFSLGTLLMSERPASDIDGL